MRAQVAPGGGYPFIRRAVVVRDRHCAFPGCRPRSYDCHHIQHWALDGDTKTDNLCLLCSAHHTLIHHSYWTIVIADGLPWFIPPTWLDPQQRPRHNRPWRTDPVPGSAVRSAHPSPDGGP